MFRNINEKRNIVALLLLTVTQGPLNLLSYDIRLTDGLNILGLVPNILFIIEVLKYYSICQLQASISR